MGQNMYQAPIPEQPNQQLQAPHQAAVHPPTTQLQPPQPQMQSAGAQPQHYQVHNGYQVQASTNQYATPPHDQVSQSNYALPLDLS